MRRVNQSARRGSLGEINQSESGAEGFVAAARDAAPVQVRETLGERHIAAQRRQPLVELAHRRAGRPARWRGGRGCGAGPSRCAGRPGWLRVARRRRARRRRTWRPSPGCPGCRRRCRRPGRGGRGSRPVARRTWRAPRRRRTITRRMRSWMTMRRSSTHWAKSLSGEQDDDLVDARRRSGPRRWRSRRPPRTRPSATARCRAPRTPPRRAGTGDHRSGGMPSPVLYPANSRLRNDSMTWSVATATWVTSASRSSVSVEAIKPRIAPTSRPSGAVELGSA